MIAQQALALSRRSLVATLRQPQLIVPTVLFPLLFVALNTAALNRSTRLPGFPPVDSFLDFALATAVVQGVLFGGSGGGTDMATDIESGFLDRLVTSPVVRPAILVGRLAGAAALGVFQAAVFVAVLVLFGAEVKTGPAGVAVILASALLLAVGVGGLSVAIALRTGSAEAVQAFFPVFFAALFTSSAFFPRNLMSGWFAVVATLNPLSWLIEALRHLVIVGFDAGSALRAVVLPGALAGIAVAVAAAQLRRRVAGPA